MSEEKKTYAIIGQVTIGTDEYRDLIEAVKESEAKAAKERHEWCEEYTKRQDLERQLTALKTEFEKYGGFINSSEEVKTRYKLYLAERQMAAMESSRED